MSANHLPGEPRQKTLLPEVAQDWRPAGHLAHFNGDTADTLDPSAFHARHDRDGPCNPPVHPAMMVKAWERAVAISGACFGVLVAAVGRRSAEPRRAA